MKETFESTNICARADDLIAYLYNETSAEEARDFQNHMRTCAACREEFAAFGQVRERIVEWRDESLGAINSPSFVQTPAPIALNSLSERKRSALAALREFFTLSPAWLRAATAFASILFCVLAVIAISHFADKQSQPVVAEGESNSKRYTEQEANALAERVAKQKVDEFKKQQEYSQQSKETFAASDRNAVAHTTFKHNAAAPDAAFAKNSNPATVTPKRAIHPLTEREREQLAEDLGLAASNDEDDLPRLSDVLGNESN